MTDSILSTYHFLLVDDDPFQLKLLSHVLAGMGVARERIHSLLHGEEALEYLGRPDAGNVLLMLDLNMPDMDGVEVVRQMAERNLAVAIVLVSGEDKRILETVEKLARARNLAVVGSIDKPVSRESLEALLQQWVPTASQPKARITPRYTVEAVTRAIRGGELTNVYQPQVNILTGALEGVETLVRWRHPEDGVVGPDHFISIAEANGLIDELTHTVLSEAVRQLGQWRLQGLNLRVAVNVSMDNLNEIGFADFVLEEMDKSRVPMDRLILEVTESRLMTDTVVSLDILTRLRLKHVGLSIDDFGTGHSSLAQLRDIPFDELKIDRGFVHGAATNPTIRSIVEGSHAMARQLNMTVVAEGVEDKEDWEYLRARGIDLAQGYFVARPIAPENLPAWIEEWNQRRGELIA